MPDEDTAVIDAAVAPADTSAADFEAAVEAEEKATGKQGDGAEPAATSEPKTEPAPKKAKAEKTDEPAKDKAEPQPKKAEKAGKAEAETAAGDDEPGPAAKHLAEIVKPAKKDEPKAETEPKPAAEPKADAEPKATTADDKPKARTFKWVNESGKEVETTTEAWAKEFPDFAAFHEARLQEMIEQGVLVDQKRYNDLRDAVIRSQSEAFDDALSERWPNWREIGSDPKSEFRQWLSKQDAETQKLLNSPRARHAKALLSAWEEHVARDKQRTEAAQKRAQAEKERQDKLHGDTLAGGGSRDAGPQDGDDPFDAEAERLDKMDRRRR